MDGRMYGCMAGWLAGWMAGWMVVARGYMYSATKEYELNCTVLFRCVFVSKTRFFYLGSSIILPITPFKPFHGSYLSASCHREN